MVTSSIFCLNTPGIDNIDFVIFHSNSTRTETSHTNMAAKHVVGVAALGVLCVLGSCIGAPIDEEGTQFNGKNEPFCVLQNRFLVDVSVAK